MSSCNRRALIALPLALAACGFAPVYAPGGSGQRLQNAVRITEPTYRFAYLIVRRMEERLGRPSGPPEFDLSFTLDVRAQGLGTDAAGNTNRFNLIGVAGYVLRETATGREVTSGTVNSFTGFFADGTTTEAQAASRDAQERLMVILADQIVVRLLAATPPA